MMAPPLRAQCAGARGAPRLSAIRLRVTHEEAMRLVICRCALTARGEYRARALFYDERERLMPR